MSSSKGNYSLAVGLLIVALTWFLFTGYQFIKGAYNIFKGPYFWVTFTDSAGMFGLAFRTMAALIAVFTILFFVAKKNLSGSELRMSVRWVLLGELVAYLALFPVVIWGFQSLIETNVSTIGLGNFLESTLPVMVESIGIPIVLAKLFFELGSNKPVKSAIKWALLAGLVYVLVLWVDNTGNWYGAISREGFEYVTSYPDHIYSFGVTVFGLLGLLLYTGYFVKKTVGVESLGEVNFRKIGGIITIIGLYFLSLYTLWLFLGTNEKWSTWYAWLLGHNMNLWMLSLPMVGLPLLFLAKIKRANNRSSE